MFKRIDHVELIPKDIEKSIKFYTEVLQFSLTERQSIEGAGPLKEYVYLELGDTRIELVSYENPAPVTADAPHVGYRAIAIEVDDMDATIALLKEKGVALTSGPMDLGNSITAEICDPDGLPIELMQW